MKYHWEVFDISSLNKRNQSRQHGIFFTTYAACVVLNYTQICNTEKLMTKGLELLFNAQKVLLG